MASKDRVTKCGSHMRRLLMALSSPFDDEASYEGARAFLTSTELSRSIDELYLHLTHQRTLPTGLRHLERAGGDLRALTIFGRTFDDVWPLNHLIPRPDADPDDRMSLDSIGARLTTHVWHLDKAVMELADTIGSDGFVLLGATALRAAYPGYQHRWGHDVDVFTPDLQSGLRVTEALVQRYGFTLTAATIAGFDDSGFGRFSTDATRDGHVLSVGVFAGGQSYGPRNISLRIRGLLPQATRRVTWNRREWLVPCPEDLLLTLAAKVYRTAEFPYRNVVDVRFLLEAEPELDWDLICWVAIAAKLNGVLSHLLAETTSVPSLARDRLSPGRVERKLVGRSARQDACWSALRTQHGDVPRFAEARYSQWWPQMWALRYVRARAGLRHAVCQMVGDRLGLKLLGLRWRVLRAGVNTAWLGLLRTPGGTLALCELDGARRVEERRCLAGSLPRARRLGAALGAGRHEVFNRLLQLTGPAEGPGREGGSVHHCNRFVVNLGRRWN